MSIKIFLYIRRTLFSYKNKQITILAIQTNVFSSLSILLTLSLFCVCRRPRQWATCLKCVNGENAQEVWSHSPLSLVRDWSSQMNFSYILMYAPQLLKWRWSCYKAYNAVAFRISFWAGTITSTSTSTCCFILDTFPHRAWCEVFKVDYSTLKILEHHKNGKRHKKNLQVHNEYQRLIKVIHWQQKVQMYNSELNQEVFHENVE